MRTLGLVADATAYARFRRAYLTRHGGRTRPARPRVGERRGVLAAVLASPDTATARIAELDCRARATLEEGQLLSVIG